VRAHELRPLPVRAELVPPLPLRSAPRDGLAVDDVAARVLPRGRSSRSASGASGRCPEAVVAMLSSSSCQATSTPPYEELTGWSGSVSFQPGTRTARRGRPAAPRTAATRCPRASRAARESGASTANTDMVRELRVDSPAHRAPDLPRSGLPLYPGRAPRVAAPSGRLSAVVLFSRCRDHAKLAGWLPSGRSGSMSG
jgi:hypothetical protein